MEEAARAPSRRVSRRPRPSSLPVLRPGAVLARTFSIWLRNVVPFTVLTAVVYSPFLAYSLWVVHDDATLLAHYGRWETVNNYAAMVLWYLATGAVTYGVVQQLRGRPASAAASVRVGLRRLLPVLGVGLLVALYTIAAMFVLVFFAALIAIALRSTFVMVALLGAAMLAVFATVGSMFWTAVPVAVVEAPGVRKSLSRSRDLTRGNLARVFAVLLVLFLLAVGLGLLLGLLNPSDPDTPASRRFEIYANLALAILVTTPLGAVASAVGYHDLRVGKEGADVEDLARVFE